MKDREEIVKMLPEFVCTCNAGAICECGWRAKTILLSDTADKLTQRLAGVGEVKNFITDGGYTTRYDAGLLSEALSKEFIILRRIK